MIDVAQQIAYWKSSAEEDLAVGRDLVTTGRVRHGLFFVHLALEKILKAHVCRILQDLPPRIHNLVRLVEVAKLAIEKEHGDTLADMNAFNLEGRYPTSLGSTPTNAEAIIYLQRSESVFKWLNSQL